MKEKWGTGGLKERRGLTTFSSKSGRGIFEGGGRGLSIGFTVFVLFLFIYAL